MTRTDFPTDIINGENAKEFTADPSIMMGKAVIRGTRITVELILEKLAAGESIRQILSEHHQLSELRIRAALDYAVRVLKSDIVYSPVA